jgi:hypothetical protein
MNSRRFMSDMGFSPTTGRRATGEPGGDPRSRFAPRTAADHPYTNGRLLVIRAADQEEMRGASEFLILSQSGEPPAEVISAYPALPACPSTAAKWCSTKQERC